MKQNKPSSTFCENFAIRNTAPRQRVWGILKRANRPMSVFEIEEALNGEVCLSTVYRVLAAFVKSNICTKKVLDETKIYYELKDPAHNHYAVCTKCRNRIKLKECPIKVIPGFEITGHSIEIYGICKRCRSVHS